MICRDRKLIFVHIPKCGGTSVEDMLWPRPRKVEDLWLGYVAPGYNKYQSGGLQHLTAQQIRQEVGDETFQACYRFALVRDPVDRLVSQYNALNRRKDLLAHLGMGFGRDFTKYLRRIRKVAHVQWKPQVDFLLDAAGDMTAEAFKLEDIDETFPALAARIGLTEDRLVHSNSMKRPEIPANWKLVRRDGLTQDEMDSVYEIFRDDFDRLGYPPPVSAL